MKVYITRHGQVVDVHSLKDGAYPKGEIPLSSLGREQAAMLGEQMKRLGFSGKILSSPYMRTMETASIIAGIVGVPIYPYPPIYEIFLTENAALEYEGLTLEELRGKYPHIAADAELSHPWWIAQKESYDMVKERVAAGVSKIEQTEEILFVAHGASVSALLAFYRIPKRKQAQIYNCSLSIADPGNPAFRPVYCDVSHIPYEKRTNNFKTCEETETEFFSAPYEPEIALPEGFRRGGRYMLHIGDTYSVNYPYYRKLIELVKPEIILHTGDMAEEVKVGRIPETAYEYLVKLEVLLGILRDSGAKRILLAPGNNDMPDEIERRMPSAEILKKDTVLSIDDRSYQIGHNGAKLKKEADYTLYGHSMREETWTWEKNTAETVRRFNALWGSFVYDLHTPEFFRFALP